LCRIYGTGRKRAEAMVLVSLAILALIEKLRLLTDTRLRFKPVMSDSNIGWLAILVMEAVLDRSRIEKSVHCAGCR
jgi:hypothetical protein